MLETFSDALVHLIARPTAGYTTPLVQNLLACHDYEFIDLVPGMFCALMCPLMQCKRSRTSTWPV